MGRLHSFIRNLGKPLNLGPLLDTRFQSYASVNRRVGVGTKILWLVRSLCSANFREHRNLKRFCFMNNQGYIDYDNTESVGGPSIEILVLAKDSDFEMLPYVLRYGLQNSLNTVHRLRIIVPHGNELKVRSLINLEGKLSTAPLVVECEDLYILSEEKKMIQDILPDRQGWVRQQVIANRAIQNSLSNWVLLIDADTVLLRPRLWVDSNGKQVLFPTEEFHEPYYDFLKSMSSTYTAARCSFVSHHMVYNVKFLNEIMAMLGGLSACLEKALLWSRGKGSSPFDLKYEIYAQLLYLERRESVDLQKWANISLKRRYNNVLGELDVELKQLSADYCSVSYHHWNR
jgi:hypothetical protein